MPTRLCNLRHSCTGVVATDLGCHPKTSAFAPLPLPQRLTTRLCFATGATWQYTSSATASLWCRKVRAACLRLAVWTL